MNARGPTAGRAARRRSAGRRDTTTARARRPADRGCRAARARARRCRSHRRGAPAADRACRVAPPRPRRSRARRSGNERVGDVLEACGRREPGGQRCEQLEALLRSGGLQAGTTAHRSPIISARPAPQAAADRCTRSVTYEVRTCGAGAAASSGRVPSRRAACDTLPLQSASTRMMCSHSARARVGRLLRSGSSALSSSRRRISSNVIGLEHHDVGACADRGDRRRRPTDTRCATPPSGLGGRA